MNLKILSDEVLIQNLKSLVAEERRLLTSILLHLKEVELRSLHLAAGYSSLCEYAEKELLYSKDQAYRRIAAMRILSDLPEIKSAIDDGKLNLTHLTQAKHYFNSQEKKEQPVSAKEKQELLKNLENQSTRDGEKLFAKLDPEAPKPDKARFITEKLIELRFVVTEELMEKLKRFQNLDSHVQKNPNYAETLERLLDLAMKDKLEHKPGKAKAANAVRTEKPSHNKTPFAAPQKLDPQQSETKFDFHESAHQILKARTEEIRASAKPLSRYISTQVAREVFEKCNHACAYQDARSGKVCGSTHRIQIDHIRPYAKNGDSIPENLRVLCQAHNLYVAKKEFGKNRMESFIRRDQN